ncbi:hypothetical protein [Terrabacter sp. MAHUQ-38]|uniref:hypothetical protein n=1 Tax=unclassified Terrabacter TaxID=2630222 RepID=UPI00165DC86C|nr:hypothetical protein [Terrabacter sp. MAHUQ-38]MBC9822760.1 hypothetical protein [Terrabacter sp. MAHUQ-38]
MPALHRILTTLAAAVATALMTFAPTVSAAASTLSTTSSTSSTVAVAAVSSTSVPCSSVRQIGDRKVVSDLGMSAFTVRQFIGWCTDASGSAWMNFASVYVWDQYHDRGFAYRSYAGIAVRGEPETRGFTASAIRQQLSYSTPVRTTARCTQGWGKLYRSGAESAQGLTSLVC